MAERCAVNAMTTVRFCAFPLMIEREVKYENLVDIGYTIKGIVTTICPTCNKPWTRETDLMVPPAIEALSMCPDCTSEEVMIESTCFSYQ